MIVKSINARLSLKEEAVSENGEKGYVVSTAAKGRVFAVIAGRDVIAYTPNDSPYRWTNDEPQRSDTETTVPLTHTAIKAKQAKSDAMRNQLDAMGKSRGVGAAAIAHVIDAISALDDEEDIAIEIRTTGSKSSVELIRIRQHPSTTTTP